MLGDRRCWFSLGHIVHRDKRVFVVEPKGYCEPDRTVAISKAWGEWILWEIQQVKK